jgi:probable rRNA maturation factor
MNRIEISAEEVPLPAWKGRAEKFIKKVLKKTGRDGWDLSLLFCGDAFIRNLNAKYRNRDQATDVLSFPLGETLPGGRRLAGDIVISLESLRKNAIRFSVDEDEELRRLFIHGILHLDGMDHKTNNETEPMLCLQEKLLNELKDERIISPASPAQAGSSAKVHT